jgi:glycosyltransferase involved in cell wall biosynthesis
MKPPTISAVVPVYNTEKYIGQALTAILSQTLPPDEVIVVDDGSTDGTQDVLARFRGDIRVVKQANQGVAGAMTRCFEESRCAYVAKCDADDIWERDKLERQAEALRTHPEIDVAFCCALIFGKIAGQWAMRTGEDPSVGIMDRTRFGRTLFRSNPICPSTTVVRRALFQRVGPFRDTRCEDYDYWMRALSAGAVFYYDPTVGVHYRRHDNNVSSDLLELHRSNFLVRSLNADIVSSRAFARKVLALGLFHIARDLSDLNRPREARAAFVDAFRLRPTVRALAWMLVLSAPDPYRRTLGDGLVSAKRTLSSAAR